MPSYSSDHSSSSSSNGKSRKTFVLKCDRPRYDGGVEIDLQKFFGRPLQPNMALLRKRQVSVEQLEALKKEARQLLNESQALTQSNAPTVSAEQALLEAAPVTASPSHPKPTPTKARVTSVTTHSQLSPDHAPCCVLGNWLLQGPSDIVFGVVGLCASLVACLALLAYPNPVLKCQTELLVKDCFQRMGSGCWQLLQWPIQRIVLSKPKTAAAAANS